ncbi:hypothetical protein AB833_11870 [Chromatiales bacterium (ex Bugula neritina AB1)]|nr:hypothetical protein AB833_11870 [Chromatiales bacterium (ex Bugula neritina AB1)]
MSGASDFEVYETSSPDDPVIDQIAAGLIEYNLQFVGRSKRHYTVAVKDSAGGLIGGAECVSAWQWMMVENVYVVEQHRKNGVGTRLMSMVESEARNRQCTGICLDTFTFQARGFYEKLGYEIFGELPDFPAGVHRYYLRKLLAQ